jgi:hypothetical protein
MLAKVVFDELSEGTSAMIMARCIIRMVAGNSRNDIHDISPDDSKQCVDETSKSAMSGRVGEENEDLQSGYYLSKRVSFRDV